ncbi:MAG: GAF domain-containing protein [Candidatus Levyibacteriota bacterium]
MFADYLKKIGQSNLVESVEKVKLNTIVENAFSQDSPIFSDKEVENLFVYKVPKMSPDGSCSIIDEPAEKPYNLAATFGLSHDRSSLIDNSQIIRLWRLRRIVDEIFALTKVDWFGIYRKITNPKGKLVLVKEAYKGLFSRAEFPLTEEFAKNSNNSTVGLTGKAVVIQNVAEHAGPYYKCDGKVNSEFCSPIFGLDGNLIGIIDAESFENSHYSHEKLLQIAKVCFDLGQRNLGI